MPERILRLPDVLKRTGLGRSTIYAMISRGEFPRNLSLSKRATGWREADIEEWLASRAPLNLN